MTNDELEMIFDKMKQANEYIAKHSNRNLYVTIVEVSK